MNTFPPIQEATKDLQDIRKELKHMRTFNISAKFLSNRIDVDSEYYYKAYIKSTNDILKGERVEQCILELYPSLT